jgi:CheY-like chemotaxis protein
MAARSNNDTSGPPVLKILLVEDNPVNQIVASTLLKHLGHGITIAGNGREALQAVQREPYDVIFMDIQMPYMDGLEATARIRRLADVKTAEIPIVALTAHAIGGYRDRCLAAGMDEFLTKPVSSVKLSEVLDRLNELRRRRQETSTLQFTI